MPENAILYERGPFWVRRDERGHFEVLKNSDGGTHSFRVATIGASMGLARAIAEIDRRINYTKGANK